MSGLILGIDPGTRKVGYALVDAQGRVLHHAIAPPEALLERVRAILGEQPVESIALGGGTNSKPFERELAGLGVAITLVDEYGTSLQARALYFADHPPRGWRRLIPLSLQLPPEPIDDYAAVLIARRYLSQGASPAAS